MYQKIIAINKIAVEFFKNLRYLAYDASDMKELKRFIDKFERYELAGDVTFAYLKRLFHSYIGRWRELIIYVQTVYLLKFKKMGLHHIEEKILK